ncbi:hypothetical protein ES703_40424 [subsurface metagenome]
MMGVQKRKIWNLVISSVIVLLLGNVQTVLASSVTLSGILRYDGQPMSDITDMSPTFFCRNLETGQGVSGITSTYDNNTGVYSITGLPSAKVRILVKFYIPGDRPTLPGNYRVWKSADIPNLSLDQRVNFDIGLEQIIHMTSPWDNDAIGPLTYPADPYPEHSGGLDFAWDAVPGATHYWIDIFIYRDPDHPDGYGRVESVLNSYVQETSFSTNLDLSNDLQHYQARILAYGSGGNLIGLFMMTYENGYGWDYRFKVVAPSDVDGVLAYDDGTFEIYPMINESQYLRQRFLVSDFGLSGDYLIKTVRINWGPTSEDFAGEIKLRDYDTGEVMTAVSFTRPASGWQDYDISGSGFVSDHFYVELWRTGGFGYICGDTDAPHYGMSEFSTNSGENWHVSALEMDFMVRALVVPGVPPEKAYNPDPADGAQFIAPNVILSWEPGFGAKLHHVYFGDNFANVNDADTSDTTGIYRGTQAATTYTPGPLELEKTYYWRVDEFDGSAMHKGDVWSFTTRAVANVEDFETGDFSKFPWEHYGDETWTWDVTSRQKHSGAYSANAGSIDHDQSTTLQVTVDCRSGNISFYRKVSSELGYDYLKFYIDGVEKGKWSGEEDWAEVSFGVTAGTRTFEWTYSKDGSESEGDDTTWIDDIVFPIE